MIAFEHALAWMGAASSMRRIAERRTSTEFHTLNALADAADQVADAYLSVHRGVNPVSGEPLPGSDAKEPAGG